MKRAMCVYFPSWPLQRLLHARPELRSQPVVIAQPTPTRGAKVRLGSTRAVQAGVRADMPVAEARAIVPHVVVCDDDPPSDRRALQKLAAWAERYSPIVGLEEATNPECLFLDITGCADCFHGEDRLAELAREEFRAEGWTVRVAIADTLGAAWAQAHFPAACGVARKAPFATPQAAPVAALRLPEETLQTLTALGIDTVGQLLEVPRDSLPGRLGPMVLRRLDQMLGKVPELIVPYKYRPEVQARCSFEYATDRRAVLDHALDQLLERVVTKLREHQRGAKHLKCWFYHERAEPTCFDVRLFRPSHSLDHLRKLLSARLEQTPISAPVIGVCLRAVLVEIMVGRQYELFEPPGQDMAELAALIDRLVSQFGRDAVSFATLVADPQPEYACRFEPAVGRRDEGRGARDEGRGTRGEKKRGRGARGKKSTTALSTQYPVPSTQHSVLSTQHLPLPLAPRPSILVPRPDSIEVFGNEIPLRLRHAGKEYVVTRSWGPERIETGWWRGQDVQRDYYLIETGAGTRWWIFHCNQTQRWFVHGWFD